MFMINMIKTLYDAINMNKCIFSQTLSFEYTFVAKNIPLNILPKTTRRYTVSGENIPFNRPIYADSDNNKPFLT